MATLHAKGELRLDQDFRHEGILGTIFTGRLVEETQVGPYRAVVPTISGQAWITGFAQYVVDAEDPFPEGFTVGDIWAGGTIQTGSRLAIFGLRLATGDWQLAGRQPPATGREPDDHFFGYPTDCASTMICVSRSLSALPSAALSTDARTTVARPSEAQNR